MDRLSMLETMVVKRPDDPFPKYGLAMEYRRLDRPEDARAAFERLIEAHPDYIPSYLMAGNLLADLELRDEARAVLSRGVQVATAARDDHARGELEVALAELGGAGTP
jgi:tetratricopeptide (TPR) repeat protein